MWRQKHRRPHCYGRSSELVALFILFIALWLAQYLARQISTPITALLQAVGEVSRGNLARRVAPRPRIDELAAYLVRRLQPDDRRPGGQSLRTGIPPPVYRSDSGEYSHWRHFGRLERRHSARQQGSDARCCRKRKDAGHRAWTLFPPEDADGNSLPDESGTTNGALIAPVRRAHSVEDAAPGDYGGGDCERAECQASWW